MKEKNARILFTFVEFLKINKGYLLSLNLDKEGYLTLIFIAPEKEYEITICGQHPLEKIEEACLKLAYYAGKESFPTNKKESTATK